MPALVQFVCRHGLADRREFVLGFAQVFGQKLHFALAGNMGLDAAGEIDLLAQAVAERHLFQLTFRQVHQGLGQGQNIQGLAALLAAAGATVEFVRVEIVTHGRHCGESELFLSTKQALMNIENSQEELARLQQVAEDVLARARALGATQAEVGLNIDAGLNVNVRLGEVETVEHTRDRGVAVTVYVGQRKGAASTADIRPESLRTTVEQAIAIARYTEADPCAGLADAERMARDSRDFDQWHPWALSADTAIELGLRCEQAGRDLDLRINNSDGASVASNASLTVYANSHGFVGSSRDTRHSVSCALLAEDEAGMQRDYWYSTALAAADLEPVESIGRRAAERTLARLSPRKLATTTAPVLFSPELGRGLIGSLISAISGGALYRRASFLIDSIGTALLPDSVSVLEDPWLSKGFASCWFDAEGVATKPNTLIADGVLQRYVLGSYSARKLGLTSTGNAGGIHNLQVLAKTPQSFEQLLAQMGRGLLVTELMGQGLNLVTGDYSRGAAGFWVEQGQIAYPVDEVTIAGNLRQMLRGIVGVGSDVDRRSHLLCGSLLIDQMTIAGA